MVLTKTDREQLNKAILEYLFKSNYSNAYDALLLDADIDESAAEPSKKNLLETKWKSVAKLKKQIMQL